MKKLVECVPNISEGQRRDLIDRIVAATSIPGVQILNLDVGAGANRTVITFAAEPEVALEAAFQLYMSACASIDMRVQKGEHPRIGAIDVFPFVPLQAVTLEECVDLAKRLAKRVASELKVPVFLYEAAASSTKRRSLAYLRKGEYEGLEKRLQDAEFQPDFGEAKFNPTAGATVIGARPFLIAYNVNLNTSDKEKASWIAERIRESGSKKLNAGSGQFKNVRAIGWYIEEYKRAQVSINFTNFEITPIHPVFERVCELAKEQGIEVTGSELVGLIPKAALLSAGKFYAGSGRIQDEQELLLLAVKHLGLSDLAPFKLEQRVIEYKLKQQPSLLDLSVTQFLNKLASAAPTPGGGSVAALNGALSAALLQMVCELALAKPKKLSADLLDKLKDWSLKAAGLKRNFAAQIDRDSEVFDLVMAVYKDKTLGDEVRNEKLFDAYMAAADVPLQVAIAALECSELANKILAADFKNTISDAQSALENAKAAYGSAMANVRINQGELARLASTAAQNAAYAELVGKIEKCVKL